MTQWFSLKRLFGRREPAAPEALWAPPDIAEPDEQHQVSPLAAPLHVRSGSALVRVDNGVLAVEREGEARSRRVGACGLTARLANQRKNGVG